MASLSLPPLRRVLAWAVEQGMAVRGQLSEEEIGALERAFAGTEPWSFEQYTGLRIFAYAMARLNLPDIPATLSFGDMLQALDELRQARSRRGRLTRPSRRGTFSELSYASTSAGITLARDENAASWREHGVSNKQLLLQGAERAAGTRAVVVGAGKLYDIPLRKLAERFEQLLLVDIDPEAMAESVKQAGLPPTLHARLSLIKGRRHGHQRRLSGEGSPCPGTDERSRGLRSAASAASRILRRRSAPTFSRARR